jgi:hypothetical protein
LSKNSPWPSLELPAMSDREKRKAPARAPRD